MCQAWLEGCPISFEDCTTLCEDSNHMRTKHGKWNSWCEKGLRYIRKKNTTEVRYKQSAEQSEKGNRSGLTNT